MAVFAAVAEGVTPAGEGVAARGAVMLAVGVIGTGGAGSTPPGAQAATASKTTQTVARQRTRTMRCV